MCYLSFILSKIIVIIWLATVSFNYAFEITVVLYLRPLITRNSGTKKNEKILSINSDLWINTLYSFGTCRKLSTAFFSTSIKRFYFTMRSIKIFISNKFSTFKSREVTDVLRHYYISWEFILQKLTWWEGFYGKLIVITKIVLKKVVGKVRKSFIDKYYDKLIFVPWDIGI